MSTNKISSLEVKSFHNLYKVHTIDLSNNELLNIPKDAFCNALVIITIKLNNNPLMQLQVRSTFIQIVYSSKFDICCTVS